MDEFIREVDEEYRRQRINEIWQRYSILIVGLAICLVAAVGGWRYWQHRETQLAEAASGRFEAALQLSRDGKSDEAEKALGSLAGDGSAGYRLLARFRLAAELGKGNVAEGVKAYDALANDNAIDASMRDLARLRGAMLRMTGDDAAGSVQTLEQLATPTNAWRHTAREMLGLAALRKGDAEGAGRWFDQIASDRETPAGLRSRLEVYTALAAGGPVQTTQ